MLLKKKQEKKYYLGIDLQEKFCQISWISKDRLRMTPTGRRTWDPVTFSMTAGREDYNIPACICRGEDGRWLTGREATAFAAARGTEPVTGLLRLAALGETVRIGEEDCDPVTLLSVYLRRCLQLLSSEVDPEDIESIVFTVPSPDRQIVEALDAVLERLQLPVENISYQGHMECLFDYVLAQQEQQRRLGVILCENDGGSDLLLGELIFNYKTKPAISMPRIRHFELTPGASAAVRDRQLLDALRQMDFGTGGAAVYLIGDGFKGRWMQESLRFIGQGRRVFQGGNLYSRGAAFGALFKSGMVKGLGDYFYLAEDCLRMNVGVEAVRAGKDCYHALLDAGTKWYDAVLSEEFLLESGNEIELVLTPLNGGGRRTETILLRGLPERPPGTTRIRLTLTMDRAEAVSCRVEDLGFGAIFPSSGLQWTGEVNVI